MRSPRHGTLALTCIVTIGLSACGVPMQNCGAITYTTSPITVLAGFPGAAATLICK